jgi:hypothetical protein
MSLTRQWLETKPASTDKIKDFPAEAQARWKDIRELFNSGGHVCDGASPLSEQGRHAVNASGIASPDIYKADRVTKIFGWADAGATILAGYPLTGSKNIPEVTLDDYCIGVDVKGYQRAVQEFAIFESNPVDTLINVKAGIYFVGTKSAYHAGGTLAVGSAPLTLPSAGNKAQYAIVINNVGTLTARKGAEVAFAGSTVSPEIQPGDNLIGYVEIRADSVSFSMATSGVNAFFVRDGRSVVKGSVAVAISATSAVTGANESSTLASKSVTTGGGILLIIGRSHGGATSANLSIDRGGTNIARLSNGGYAHTIFAVDSPAAGTYTYNLKSDDAGSGLLVILELPTSVLL